MDSLDSIIEVLKLSGWHEYTYKLAPINGEPSSEKNTWLNAIIWGEERSTKCV
ncbi:MAG: hypothetical protein RL497_2291, partial [Pseudomonadota bacterium]